MNQQNHPKPSNRQNNMYYPHNTTQQTTPYNNYQYYAQQHTNKPPQSTSSNVNNPTPYRILPPNTSSAYSTNYSGSKSTASTTQNRQRYNYNKYSNPNPKPSTTSNANTNNTGSNRSHYPSTANANTHNRYPQTSNASSTANSTRYAPRYQYNPSYPSTANANGKTQPHKQPPNASSLHSSSHSAYNYPPQPYSNTNTSSTTNTTNSTYPRAAAPTRPQTQTQTHARTQTATRYPQTAYHPPTNQPSTYPYPQQQPPQTAPSATAPYYAQPAGYNPNMYPPPNAPYPPQSHPNYTYPPNTMYPPQQYTGYPSNTPYTQTMQPAPYPMQSAPYPSVHERYKNWKESRYNRGRRGRDNRDRPRDKWMRGDRHRRSRDRDRRDRPRDHHARRDKHSHRDRDRDRKHRERDHDRYRDRERERDRRSKRSDTPSRSRDREISKTPNDEATAIKTSTNIDDDAANDTKSDDNKLLIINNDNNNQIPQTDNDTDNTEHKTQTDNDIEAKEDIKEEDPSAIHALLLAAREPKTDEQQEDDNDSDDDIDKKNIERRRNVDYDKFANHTVSVEGDNIPKCMERFEDVLSHESTQQLVNNLKREHFSKPTPIQKHCLPILLENRDVMACAQTGSGKTLAFLLPIIGELLITGEVNRVFFAGKTACCLPLALIMAPTRELTIQIDEQVYKMTRDTWIRSFAVFGGDNYEDQAREIEKFQVDILCATPGRLMDMVDGCKVSLEYIKHLAFDEADNMLDLGFDDKVQQLVNERGMPDKTLRQTVMFSATFPEAIQLLAKDFMKEFVFVKVGNLESSPGPITSIVKWVDESQKRDTLLKDIAETSGKIIVFCGRRQIAESTCNYLKDHLDDDTIGCLHGHMNQHCREETILKFKDDEFRILCATSVAARGLDFPSIEKVINYDMPVSIQNYTHRIGRTGRIGNNGIAISYFNHTSRSMAAPLLQYLRTNHQTVPHWLNEIVRKRDHRS